jgi:phage terminase small subunit
VSRRRRLTKPGLNPKQRAFAREYVADHNATQAAIRAGYSPRSARSQCHDLLRKPAIQQLVADLEAKQEQRQVLDVKRMDALLEDLQEANLTDAFNEDGTLKLPHEFPERLKHAAVKIKTREIYDEKGKLTGYAREVALEGKQGAIRLGYQRRGVLVEKHEVAVTGHAELVAAAAQILADRAAAEKASEPEQSGAPIGFQAEGH